MKRLCVPCIRRAHLVSIRKNSKIQILVLNTSFFYKISRCARIFPEGVSPFPRNRDKHERLKPESLARGKVVYREVCTEGSQTAKSGTDEQERYMRHSCLGKQAHLCNALRLQERQLCRYRRHRRKEEALTRGGLGID